MAQRYQITPSQVAALRALGERIVEASSTEVAVSALLLPNQARNALGALERLGLVNSWIPIAGRTGDHLYVLSGEGPLVHRVLAEYEGIPPVGTILRLPRAFPTFSGWISGQQSFSYVEIVPEP